MKGNWKIVMVGRFNYCQSCDENCGKIYLVNAFFEEGASHPCCLNSKRDGDQRFISPIDLSFWTPEKSSRQNIKSFNDDISSALSGEIYSVDDFNEGGRFYNDYLRYKSHHDERWLRMGISLDEFSPLKIKEQE